MITGDHYYGSKMFFDERDFDRVGCSPAECMSVLNKLGYKYEFIVGNKIEFDKLGGDAILILKTHEMNHAVVWDWKKCRVRDPNVGLQSFRHRSKKEYMRACVGAIVLI
jgi:hypothetical protein